VEASHAQNVLHSHAYELKRELSKIGKPVDRKDWLMSPPTVNAYYHPSKNHMVFPAGILQPPFYSVASSEPVNLGAMGMVVGHELTHGFDDEGSKFDKDGNLANWWGPTVRERFDAKTECVQKQYSSFEALPGLHLNGKLTLGENIADLGGIKLAFAAHRALADQRTTESVADGFTEDQQFFLGTAQAWCGKVREEETRMRVLTDPHSPPRNRVNGPLVNLSAFAEAFSCAPGSGMSPESRCSVW
jgi:putative endopeptidase